MNQLSLRHTNPRRPVVLAGGLVTLSTLSASLAAALSVTLVAALPAASVSAWRLVISAVVTLLIWRPRLVRRPAGQWLAILGFGAGMAGISICLHEALTRIPVGIAITLEFLGPCAVALLASRRLAEAFCALLALLGVVLIAGPGGTFDLAGFAWALGAAGFLGLYTVFAEKVGKSDQARQDMALSLLFAAGITSPFWRGGISGITVRSGLLLLASALLGVLLPYLADMWAARLSSARVVGTLFALDPVMGVAVGALLLGQTVQPISLLGIGLVVASGAGLVWCSGQRPRTDQTGRAQTFRK